MDLQVTWKGGANQWGARGADAQLLVGLIFTVLGASFLTMGLGMALWTAHFLSRSVSAQGTVVQMRAVQDAKTHTETYAPVIGFVARDGHSYTVDSHSSSNPPSYVVGEMVRVLYDPEDPAEGKIDSVWQVWGIAIVFSALGSLFLLTGIVLLWIGRRRKRREAAFPGIGGF
jgi:hypothetical protein